MLKKISIILLLIANNVIYAELVRLPSGYYTTIKSDNKTALERINDQLATRDIQLASKKNIQTISSTPQKNQILTKPQTTQEPTTTIAIPNNKPLTSQKLKKSIVSKKISQKTQTTHNPIIEKQHSIFTITKVVKDKNINKKTPLQKKQTHENTIEVIKLALGEGRLISLKDVLYSAFLSNPDVADITNARSGIDKHFQVFAKKYGISDLQIIDKNNKLLKSYRIVVEPNIAIINDNIKKLFNDSYTDIQYIGNKVIVSGIANSPTDAKNIIETIKGYLNSETADNLIINRMTLKNSTQVNLRVRVIEISSENIKKLGIQWNSRRNNMGVAFGFTGDNFMSSGILDLNILIDALENKNLLKTISEPNITTISGKQAKFLAGGEFPYTVPDGNGGSTIEFKEYGVSLDFKPTVFSKKNILMDISSEVSSLIDTTTGIPALNTRKAETTIELSSGQSFAIAGFTSKQSSKLENKIPVISNIPVLGELFKSKQSRVGNQELVIIVTPYLVNQTQQHNLQTPIKQIDAPYDNFIEFLNDDFFK